MKHSSLIFAIGDSVVDELKSLLMPLVEAELARQRTGGDPHSPPALPTLVRSPDRFRLKTRVQWSAAEQLAVMSTATQSLADAIRDRVAVLARDVLIAEKVASGEAEREFKVYVAESKAIPEAQRAARARLEKLRDAEACIAAAGARRAVEGLIASMRAKRERRSRAA